MTVALRPPMTLAQVLAWEARQALRFEFDEARPVAMKLEVAGRVRYPDAFVVCSKVPPRAKIVADPVVVFESLRDGSANDDVVVKNADHRATASIQRYVALQQSAAGATVSSRQGAAWLSELVSGLDGVLRLPELGFELALAAIYADIDFDGEPDAGPP